MDVSNWVDSGAFKLSDGLNLKASRSIAKSRAETRLSYRSKTSKVDRRKYKKQAILQKLEYEDKMSKISLKSPKNREKLMAKLNLENNVPVSGAQADVALFKMKERHQAKKEKSPSAVKKSAVTPKKQAKAEEFQTVSLLKQLKDSGSSGSKKTMKKGHMKKKDQAILSQIQLM